MRKLPSFFFAALCALAPAAIDAATSIVRGPYLQSATPTSLVVRWRTDLSEGSVVNYGTEQDKLTLVARAQGVGTEHIVQLTELAPATRYFYRVGTGTEKTDCRRAARRAVFRRARRLTTRSTTPTFISSVSIRTTPIARPRVRWPSG